MSAAGISWPSTLRRTILPLLSSISTRCLPSSRVIFCLPLGMESASTEREGSGVLASNKLTESGNCASADWIRGLLRVARRPQKSIRAKSRLVAIHFSIVGDDGCGWCKMRRTRSNKAGRWGRIHEKVPRQNNAGTGHATADWARSCTCTSALAKAKGLPVRATAKSSQLFSRSVRATSEIHQTAGW